MTHEYFARHSRRGGCHIDCGRVARAGAGLPVRARSASCWPFSPGGGTDLLARLLSKRFLRGVRPDRDGRQPSRCRRQSRCRCCREKRARRLHAADVDRHRSRVNVSLYSKLPFDVRRDLIPDHARVASAPAGGDGAPFGAGAQRAGVRGSREENPRRASTSARTANGHDQPPRAGVCSTR